MADYMADMVLEVANNSTPETALADRGEDRCVPVESGQAEAEGVRRQDPAHRG